MGERRSHVGLFSWSAVMGMLTKNINKPEPAPSAGNKGTQNNNTDTSMESCSDLFGESHNESSKLLLPLFETLELDNGVFEHFVVAKMYHWL